MAMLAIVSEARSFIAQCYLYDTATLPQDIPVCKQKFLICPVFIHQCPA